VPKSHLIANFLGSVYEFGGKTLGKRKMIGTQLERGFVFLHNTKSPQNGGAQKLYRSRVLEGLDKFFKSNLCCYNNTLKIKKYMNDKHSFIIL